MATKKKPSSAAKASARKKTAAKSPKRSSDAVDKQLARYQSMRDFNVTAEPSGKGGTAMAAGTLPFAARRYAPVPAMAARFHKGLARAIVAMATKLAGRDHDGGPRFDTVALSGGCLQNRILFEEVVRRLKQENFVVLTHAQVPANDGGLALGQAAIGAAHLIDVKTDQTEGSTPCASGFQAAL